MSDNKKEAGAGKAVALNAAVLVASGLLSRALWEAASAASGQIDRTTNMRRHWSKIRELYPEELGGEEEDANKRNYEAIYRVAPTLAKIPQITIHYLRQAKDYATGGFDPSTIETLAKTEAAVQGARQKKYAPVKEVTPDAKAIGQLLESTAPSIDTLPIGLQDLMV